MKCYIFMALRPGRFEKHISNNLKFLKCCAEKRTRNISRNDRAKMDYDIRVKERMNIAHTIK